MIVVLKRVFGGIAFVVGLALVFVAILHPWIGRHPHFQLRLLLGGLLLGPTVMLQGLRWFRNILDMNVIPVQPDDPHIQRAREVAQASLSRLWSYLESHRYHCFVKFPMLTQVGTIEHCWAVVHARDGSTVTVSLASDPVDAPATHDQRFPVALSDIEDWQVIVSETEIRGGYSVGALAEIARKRGYGLSRRNRKLLRTFVDLPSA